MRYDFSKMDPDSFELMVRSLNEKIFGIQCKQYGLGPDGQREFVFEGTVKDSAGIEYKGRTIGQVKYKHTITKEDDYTWLIKQIDGEIERFRKKEKDYLPDNYLFYTNIVLTPAKDIGTRDKIELYIRTHNDIIKHFYVMGYDEICAMLDNNRDVAISYAATVLSGDLVMKMLKKDEIEYSDYQENTIQNEVKSRTQEYADKWNNNMFLNDFGKWDENGHAVKLSDVYIEDHLPCFIWRNNKKRSENLKELLSKYIREKHGYNKMLLILGQPGIGKSTLITWITANFTDRVDDTLIYQFASDLKDVNRYVFNSDKRQLVIGELSLSLKALDGKILILDGFDEISVEDARIEILNRLYRDLVKNNLLHNFLLIITCRENYIQSLYKIECDYITLQAWKGNQIQSFCEIYSKKSKCSVSKETMENIVRNKDVLGIPLILYMVLALEISVEKEGSIVEVYDQVFSVKEGGIYERCFNNIKKNKIERYDQPHWISLIKKQIHQISREIAIWMFENNSDGAYILEREYQHICDNVIQKYQIQESEHTGNDILIGSYFKLIKYCEGVGTGRLYFVHRSIYEYFVAEAIFNSIEDAIVDLSNESQKKFARNIAEYLKIGRLSYTINQFIEYKIKKLYSDLEVRKQRKFYRWWESAIGKMMDVGMFYYSKPIKCYKDSMFMEVNCFLNLVRILRLVLNLENKKYIMYNVKRDSLERYIRYCASVYVIWRKKPPYEILNLSKMYLNQLDLHGLDLEEVDLSDASLVKADLKNANLSKSNLQRANLKAADLQKVDLREADLRKANLREADLRGVILDCINKQYNNIAEQRLKSANLKEAYLNRSIWRKKDICKVKQFRKAIFSYLIIEDANENKRLEKNELFPSKAVHKKK